MIESQPEECLPSRAVDQLSGVITSFGLSSLTSLLAACSIICVLEARIARIRREWMGIAVWDEFGDSRAPSNRASQYCGRLPSIVHSQTRAPMKVDSTTNIAGKALSSVEALDGFMVASERADFESSQL